MSLLLPLTEKKKKENKSEDPHGYTEHTSTTKLHNRKILSSDFIFISTQL